MKLLLDTHSFLWWVEGAPALGRRAQAAISNPDNEVFLSIASCWELGIKLSLGKLRLTHGLERFIPEQLTRNGCSSVWNSGMSPGSWLCRSIIAIRSIACWWRRPSRTTSRSFPPIACFENMA